MPEIKLEHVTKRWAKFYAVEDLNLTIENNAFVTLLGPSGCGKTTTLRMIAGLETPTSGRITIGDKVVFDSDLGINVPANKRKVGFLFQNYALFPNMTVEQNILCALKKEKDPAARRAACAEALRAMRLEELAKRLPGALSGGQQQRVAIARALAMSPDILCFDEPTSALDPELTGEVLNVIRSLKTGNSTMIVVTHEMEFARHVADQVLFMADGVIAESGTPEDLFNHPKSPALQAFLSKAQNK